MFVTGLGLLTALALGWVTYSWYCLLRNYLIARKVGIPVYVIPISHENKLWMCVDTFFIRIIQSLPFGENTFTQLNWRGWEFRDKYRAHEQTGDIFIVVTPGRNWIYLCNPESLVEVFRNGKEFPRPLELFEMANVFGDNLSNVDGKRWQKHRKATATAFNEQNNELVWAETLRQGRDMVQYWKSKDTVSTVADDSRTLSLHVLSCAGFGKIYPFQGHDQRTLSSFATNYKEALQTILDNAVSLFLLGTKLIKIPWLPAHLRKLNQAVINFKKYMVIEYEAGKVGLFVETPARINLMTQLVRANQEYDGLTEAEIYGNMFIFNFAGHDTTAHTLTFAIFLLASSRAVQNWLHEELDHVLENTSMENWSYTTAFPYFKRTIAILNETLRLYSPVPMAKSTGTQNRSLRVHDKTYVLPRNSLLIPNHVAVHTHPKMWGSDSLEWKPSRWIERLHLTDSIEDEQLINVRKGSFIPWSEGVRVCPGKKFSQVEFVAAMAAVFKDSFVEPKLFPGESMEQACKRVNKLVEDDTGQVLLLQMLHPDRAPLVWKPRKGRE